MIQRTAYLLSLLIWAALFCLCSKQSPGLTAFNSNNPPSVPAITAAVQGDTSVTIIWDTVIGAQSYNLYYSTGTALDTASGNRTRLTEVVSPKTIGSLTTGTSYTFALSAVDSAGESGLSSAVTAVPTIVADVDGNHYQTVTLGTQTWMVENLKTTRFNDSTAIPLDTADTAWSNDTTPGYCWYNKDSTANAGTYGALYNWYAVNADSGKLAPTNWHIPTDSEWTYLVVTTLGANAGGKLKETGLAHWVIPDSLANDQTGFSALPGGFRDNTGLFQHIGENGYWWSSTSAASAAWDRYIYTKYPYVYPSRLDKSYGLSVRCLKNTN